MRKRDPTNKKTTTKTNTKTKTMTKKTLNTFREHLQSLILLTFETFDQSDEKTWPDQRKDNDEDKHKYKDNDKYISRTPSPSNLWDFWPLRHLIRAMRKHDLTNKKTTTKTKTNTMTMTNTFREHPQWGIFGDILRTPSDGNPREVLSLTNNSLLWIQTKLMAHQWWGLTKFHNCGQISQSWNTWNTCS